jgi:hypothetical protein
MKHVDTSLRYGFILCTLSIECATYDVCFTSNASSVKMWLTLFKEIIAVYSENLRNPKIENAEPLVV